MRTRIYQSNHEDRLWCWDIYAGKVALQSGHAPTRELAAAAAAKWILEQLENKSSGPAGITEQQEKMIGNRIARALRLRRVLVGGEARWSLGDRHMTRTDVGIFRIVRAWADDLVRNRCPEDLLTAAEKRKRV